jgi:hypothetical protein
MKHAENKLPYPSSRGASSSQPPAHRRLSHAIAKAPPRKIRIIHVLAPHIIKTEARHFRELVQRLTGKPPQKGSCASSASSTGGDASPSPSPSPPTSVSSYHTAGDEGLGVAAGIEMKEKEQEAETSSSPSGGEGGGFLRALELDGYDDGFYQGLDNFLFSSCDMDAVADFHF